MGKSDGASESPLKTLAAKRKIVQENSLTQLDYQSPSKKQKKKFVDVKTFWQMRDKQSCTEFKPAVDNKCTAVGGAEISDWCYTEEPSHGQKNLSKTESFGGNNLVFKRTGGGV